MSKVLTTSLFFSCLPMVLVSGTRNKSGLHCVSGFCVTNDYNRMESPKGQVPVRVRMDIVDILSVIDKEFSVSIYAYLALKWPEPRLFYIGKDESIGTETNFIDPRLVEKVQSVFPNFPAHLWQPNLIYQNLKSFKLTADPQPQKFLSISRENQLGISNGTQKQNVGERGVFLLNFVQGVVITFLCPMRFNYYPLDAHICKFRISTSHHSNLVLHTMDLVPRDKRKNIVLEYQVDMNVLEVVEQSNPYWGNFTLTGVELRLERHKLKYISVYYLPSGMFVAVSWVSFLIPPEIVAGRMAMLVTLFLVLINIYVSIMEDRSVEGITAIATWMMSCIYFVFGALLEYSYLLWLLKSLRRTSKNPTPQHESTLLSVTNEKIKTVDDVCLVVFPMVFMIFNGLYWCICLTRAPSSEISTPDEDVSSLSY